ncbi:hypothetical protein [Ruminococcus bicirculans (ex Wegman et al. 2014)]|uniref:hypothetical protein n=1 Tax=Ruminococcus bicirculans (ex Wegman et al. 2014) TaxID=1160721 RepID=UPI0039998F67
MKSWKTRFLTFWGEDIFDPADGDGNVNGEIHPIYDDTAVVEAYKSGDDSKLTDDKDKYILKELKKGCGRDNQRRHERI